MRVWMTRELRSHKMFAKVGKLKQEFVFRASHLERIVEVYNDRLHRWEREVLQDLVDTVPYQATFQVLFTHAGQKHVDIVQFVKKLVKASIKVMKGRGKLN